MKYKIEFDKETCIGAMSCNAVADQYWVRSDDGKVDLKNAKYNDETELYELELETDLELNTEAADLCPVNAIKIKKLGE